MPRYGGYTSTGAGKPDGSTPARRGDVAKNLRRSAEFPYDRDNSYGAPRLTGFDGQANIDMGGHQQLTPMDTTYTPWDDDTGEIEEALSLLEAAGTPYMLGKASNTPGSSMGTIPGTAGGWANSPFDQEIDDDELERAGKQKDESAWDVLSADDGMGEDGLSPLDLEIDAARSDFRSMFDDSLETYDEPRDLMLVLLGADPEYAIDVLAPEEPERMRDLYLRWGDDVCPAEDNS